MSFFGFDTKLPRDGGHSTNAPGFSQHDAFAALGGGAADDDAYVFACRLLQLLLILLPASTLKKPTMASATSSMKPTMTSTTTPLAPALSPSSRSERISTLPAKRPRWPTPAGGADALPGPPEALAAESSSVPRLKARRTGYESYKDPEYIPQLEARADIWGLKPKQPAAQKAPEPQYMEPAQQSAPAARKLMSLEEVEAMMRTQSAGTPPAQQAPPQPPHAHVPHQQQMQYGQPPYPGMLRYASWWPRAICTPDLAKTATAAAATSGSITTTADSC